MAKPERRQCVDCRVLQPVDMLDDRNRCECRHDQLALIDIKPVTLKRRQTARQRAAS